MRASVRARERERKKDQSLCLSAMKISVKTLKGNHFDIDASNTDTVSSSFLLPPLPFGNFGLHYSSRFVFKCCLLSVDHVCSVGLGFMKPQLDLHEVVT